MNTFVLVHSPLLGPASWAPVAEALAARGRPVIVPSGLGFEAETGPGWLRFVERVAAGVEDAGTTPDGVLLAGHSGAGPLLAHLGARLRPRVRAYVFVDAGLPSATSATPIAPAPFLDFLRGLAVEGRLPPWSEWWGAQDVMETLVPDAARRSRVLAELPRLPLDYFEASVPPVPGWPDAPGAYLHLSPAYDGAAREARALGWPVHRMGGDHLHLLVEPAQVAAALAAMADRAAG